jgi:hypothetical protein
LIGGRFELLHHDGASWAHFCQRELSLAIAERSSTLRQRSSKRE